MTRTREAVARRDGSHVSDATGPQIHVTARAETQPVTDVCPAGLMPVEWNSALEKNGFARGQRGGRHWKNTRTARSPQPHRVWVVAPQPSVYPQENPSANTAHPP